MKVGKPLPMLGNISASVFLMEYWQKKPLLIRQAIPEPPSQMDALSLFEAARSDSVETRLIERQGKEWHFQQGPFRSLQKRKSRHPWTLLVQGINLFSTEADSLLRRFSFIPYSRLDDVMASYAVPGGGVGPHFDNYDVFLLQVSGRRHWRISAQADLSLVNNSPLKILKHFRPSQEWILEPGDMLYLPPHWAHDGIALDHCITWSIGFRAPPASEVVSAFLDYLQEELQIPGRYCDPELKPQQHPGLISSALIDQYATMISLIKWTRRDVENFAGRYLSDPKPHIYFVPPSRPISLATFRKSALKRGIRLDQRTLMLYRRKSVFMNGETLLLRNPEEVEIFSGLADRRELDVPELAILDHLTTLARIHEMYKNGFLHLR